jgi:hypothetical protein
LHSTQANLLEVRSGAAPNKLAVYNAYQTVANYERILIGWSGNVGCIATEKGSSGGASRPISIATDGTERINVGANGAIRFNQAYTFPSTIGSNGQVLGVGAGSDLQWVTPTAPQSPALNPLMVTSLPHGLTAANIGYPMSASSVYVDTNPDAWPTGVFSDYVSPASFRYATEGSTIDISAALFATGYTIDNGGRFVFWDHSDLKYESQKPVDSDPRIGPILMVNYLESGKFNCTVLGLGPNSW